MCGHAGPLGAGITAHDWHRSALVKQSVMGTLSGVVLPGFAGKSYTTAGAAAVSDASRAAADGVDAGHILGSLLMFPSACKVGGGCLGFLLPPCGLFCLALPSLALAWALRLVCMCSLE